MILTNLERAILDMFLAGDDSLRIALREQIAQAIFTREETGVGFFIHFAVSDSSPRLPESESIWFSDIYAEVEGLEHGAGFVLMVRNGVVDYLEGHTYGNEGWPRNTDDFEILRISSGNIPDPKTVTKFSPNRNTPMNKPRLSFWQIWNMSFGFMGIQFGWGLQLANMSGIYSQLGANPDEIPILWLAGPMTGLLVQPIIGSMSDRTWNRLGRRRPYFLVGAILSSIALFFMPNSPTLWMAAGLLWILDASINISMEPFRAFVADKLPNDQRTTGFVMQSFFIGIGQTVANVLPYLFSKYGVTGTTASGVSLTVKYSFQLGAAAFLLCVLYTVFTTEEYPPEDMEAFNRLKKEKRGIGHFFAEFFAAVGQMPKTMKQLAWVQIFTWLGLFCMWMFFGLTTSYHVFGASDAKSELFRQGGEWGGICFAVYSVVCFVVAFLLPKVAAMTSRKFVHAMALVCGGVGLLSTYLIHDQYILLLTMVGVGIAWASILSMPYAILSGSLPPARMGVYMGVFNFFIVIPEIIASLTFQPLVKHVFGNNPLYVVMLGGASMLIAALLVMRVQDVGDVVAAEQSSVLAAAAD